MVREMTISGPNLWGHVHTVINEADKRCSGGFREGKFREFEREWLDPESGRIARLRDEAWFAAIPVGMQKLLTKIIRRHIRREVTERMQLVAILSAPR